MPAPTYLFNNKYMMTIGKITNVEAAMSSGYCTPESLENACNPTGSVRIPSVFVTINGHINEFQLPMICNKPMAVMVDLAFGTNTRQRNCQSLAPSNRAA